MSLYLRRCGFGIQLRYLHISGVRHGGTNVKEKINTLRKKSLVLNKSSNEFKRFQENKKIKLIKMNKSAYNKDHALHLLKTKYGATGIKLDQIGPTSSADLPYISKIQDKRLLFTLLGVNGHQLKDSVLITHDVQKFLNRNQIEKAIVLVKLARSKGAAGANLIMKYYLEELQSPRSAIDIYNWRKKSGIPLNEYTNVILFDGLSKLESPISKKFGEKVMKIVVTGSEEGTLNIKEFNSALGALANCTDYSLAFKLFDLITSKRCVRFDPITYTTMVKVCSKIEDDELFATVLNETMEKVPPSCIDSKVIYDFCKAMSGPRRDKKLNSECLHAISYYYDLELDVRPLADTDKKVKLPSMEDWRLTKGELQLNAPICSLIMEACRCSGNGLTGIKFFEKITGLSSASPLSCNEKLISTNLVLNYIKLLVGIRTTIAGDVAMQLYLDLDKLPISKTISMKLVLREVYIAMQRQASKKYVHGNEELCNKTFAKLQEFVNEVERTHLSPDWGKTVPYVAWKFILPIVESLNGEDKVHTQSLKTMVEDYLKTIAASNPTGAPAPRREELKRITLLGIRAINSLGEKLKLEGFESPDALDTTQRQQFLYRRLLLRIKQKLVDLVDSIDKNTPLDYTEINKLIPQIETHKL